MQITPKKSEDRSGVKFVDLRLKEKMVNDPTKGYDEVLPLILP